MMDLQFHNNVRDVRRASDLEKIVASQDPVGRGPRRQGPKEQLVASYAPSAVASSRDVKSPEWVSSDVGPKYGVGLHDSNAAWVQTLPRQRRGGQVCR